MSKKKGYAITTSTSSSYYIPGAKHIEKVDASSKISSRFGSDEEASREAEMDGIKLIRGMTDVDDGVYLDTPENREHILHALSISPSYKNTTIKINQNKLNAIIDAINIEQLVMFLEDNTSFGDDWDEEIEALRALDDFRS